MYWVDCNLSLSHLSYMINNRDKEVLNKFGIHLRELRLTKKLSQQELELKAEILKNQIGNIERGEVNITLITANAIAKAIGPRIMTATEIPTYIRISSVSNLRLKI